MKSELELNAMFAELNEQRNAALNNAVILSGRLAVVIAELEALKESLKPKEEPDAGLQTE